MKEIIFNTCSALAGAVSYTVFGVIGNGSYKEKYKPQGGCSLVNHWQGQATAEAREHSETVDLYRRRESDLHVEYKQELKRKEREISYLRSKLYK